MCTFNASKVTVIHFLFQGRIHAVSIGKPNGRTDVKFLDGSFFKPNMNRISVFRTSLIWRPDVGITLDPFGQVFW